MSDLQKQLEKIAKLYGIYEKEKGELIRNIITSIRLDEKLDKVKEILDRIRRKGLKDPMKSTLRILLYNYD